MRDRLVTFRLPKKAWGRAAERLCRAFTEDGGPGSGNWGHKGRPGLVGGSGAGGGKHYRGGRGDIMYTSSKRDWLNGLRGERQKEATKFLKTWEPSDDDKAKGHKTSEAVLIANGMPEDLQKYVDFLREARDLDDKAEARMFGTNLDDDEAKAYLYLRGQYGLNPNELTSNGEDATARYMTNLVAKAMNAPHIDMEMPDEVAYECGVKERPKTRTNWATNALPHLAYEARTTLEMTLGKTVPDFRDCSGEELDKVEREAFEKVAGTGKADLSELNYYLYYKGLAAKIGESGESWLETITAHERARMQDPFADPIKWPNLTDAENKDLNLMLVTMKNAYGFGSYSKSAEDRFVRDHPTALQYLALKNKALGGEDLIELAKKGDADRPNIEAEKARKAAEARKAQEEKLRQEKEAKVREYRKTVEAHKVVIKGDAYSEKIDSLRKPDGGYTDDDLQKIGTATCDEVEKALEAASKIDNTAELGKLAEESGKVKERLEGLRKEREDIERQMYFLDEYDDPKKYSELKKRRDALSSEIGKALTENGEIEAKARKIHEAKEHAAVDAVRSVLARVRKTGGISATEMKSHIPSKSSVRQCVVDAYDFYPREWFDASAKQSKLQTRKSGRGYYSDSQSLICISGFTAKGQLGTAVHELGHRFEYTIPGIMEAEKTFYARRTAGEELITMRKATGNTAYKADEVTRKDKFLHPYMGKDYGGDGYELVSMGFQYAFTEPQKLLQDRDYAQFIFGLLAVG